MNKINIIVIDKEEVSKTLIENYLKEIDSVSDISTFDSFEQVGNLDKTATPTIVVIDISENTKPSLDFIKQVIEKNNQCKFVLISYNLSTNFIVDALRTGAKEFLAKPIIKEEFIKIIKNTKSILFGEASPYSTSKVISTFSNKGGLGKTTVAVNLAQELADISKEKVVLVDLNMHLGDITAFLDINPNYDIKYVIDNLDKANKDFFLGTLEQYKDSNLFILADSPYREPSDEPSPQQFANLIKKLKESFSYVVVDNNSVLDTKTTTVFNESDLILFITAANLPTLRNCKRCLDIIDKLGYKNDKLKLVLNRYINTENYKIEDITAVLNKDIFWKIPNNYFVVIESINKGLTLQELNPTSNITQNYQDLARELINRE
ncbi:MAG: AAA family ATPase [Candidatus Gastranaerophilales bacterium]|nr:AAA family ATPase [Candidatus Gastranaerophilales bacterium]